MKLIAAAILAAASVLPVHANDSEVKSSEAHSSHYQSAYRLADLQQGGAKMSVPLVANMRSQMATAFASDPDIGFLEEEFPGVTDAMLDAIVPIAVRQTEDSMPVFFDRLAKLYMANMTESEIRDMIRFVDTPSYDRLRSSIENNIDFSEMLAADLDADITAEGLTDVLTDSVEKTVPDMSTKDRMSLVIMAAHPSFKKFSKLTEQRMKIEAEWSNESTPEEDAELDAATTAAIEKHTGLDLSE